MTERGGPDLAPTPRGDSGRPREAVASLEHARDE
jgi:hypothetical protein